MQHFLRRVTLLAATFLTVSGLAIGQTNSASLQATARADRTEIQLGQSVIVLLDVKGVDGRPEIAIPTSEDCSISFAGTAVVTPGFGGLNSRNALSSRGNGLPMRGLAESLQRLTEQLGNGPLFNPDLKGMNDPDLQQQLQAALGNLGAPKRDEQTLAYHVHVNRSGTIVVPPFKVTANGQTTTTKPIELHVSPTQGQDRVRLALSLSNPRPMVGQEVHLNVDVLIRREKVTYQNLTYPHLPVTNVQISLPALDLGPMEFVRSLGEVVKEHAPPQGHHGYKVNHLPGEAVFDKEPGDSKEELGYYRRRLEVPVRFKQAGKVVLPAAGVAGDAWMSGPSAGRRQVGRWQPFVAISELLNFDVRELPGDRPREFSGNIGELKVTTSASQAKMPAGTPFTLTVRLQGEGYLPRSGSFDLTANPEFTRRFRVLPQNDRALSDTLREVTVTLRPLNAGVKEVPPVSVSYFDSKTDSFTTAKSAPIPLEVTGTANLAEDPATGEPPAEASQDDLPPLEDLTAAHLRGFLMRNLLPVVALAVAVAVVAAVLVGGRMRRTMRRLREGKASRAVAQDHQRAAGEVRRKLDSSVHSVHDVRELLQMALRIRFDLPPGEITPHDAAMRLHHAGVDPSLVNACAELLDTCAAAEYAPGVNPVSLPELTARAERLIARLANAGSMHEMAGA